MSIGIGGEAVSMAIDYEDKHDFAAAGYAPIHTNESYVGGFVRQYGGFSFSRVFQASHGSMFTLTLHPIDYRSPRN